MKPLVDRWATAGRAPRVLTRGAGRSGGILPRQAGRGGGPRTASMAHCIQERIPRRNLMNLMNFSADFKSITCCRTLEFCLARFSEFLVNFLLLRYSDTAEEGEPSEAAYLVSVASSMNLCELEQTPTAYRPRRRSSRERAWSACSAVRRSRSGQ